MTSMTQPDPPKNRPAPTSRLGSTLNLSRGTAPIPPRPGAAAPLQAAVEGPSTADEERSRGRLAFIVAYLKDPSSDPDFADKALVYQIFVQERDHQHATVKWLLTQPGQEAALDTARTRERQLHAMLKKLSVGESGTQA